MNLRQKFSFGSGVCDIYECPISAPKERWNHAGLQHVAGTITSQNLFICLIQPGQAMDEAEDPLY